MAKPSSPSVRFTALEEPTMTIAVATRNGTKASGQRCPEKCERFRREWITRSGWKRLKNGKTNWVEYALYVARTNRTTPTTRLTKIWKYIFFLAVRPRLCCLET